jgi:restriction endonuclease Mrr
LEIAERKVSLLDDYGDERLHLLPNEVDACVVKIAGREGLVEAGVKGNLKEGKVHLLPAPLQCVHSRLPQLFAEYHHQQESRVKTKDEVRWLSGTEFEIYVARILRQHGWQVSSTPTSGDQGVDLIASKGGRKVVIQAKRYSASVGNHAVQEVVAGVSFYSGTEGYVVTNSTFTPSARDLAQKNNIRLIDGAHLEELKAL